MTPTLSGHGYWLVATDGGIFSYGDAKFYSSTGAIPLVQQISGMAATPSGHGYWLAARDGGIFAYGDARFHGSMSAVNLGVKTVTGIVATASGHGYWMVATRLATSPTTTVPLTHRRRRRRPNRERPRTAGAPVYWDATISIVATVGAGMPTSRSGLTILG